MSKPTALVYHDGRSDPAAWAKRCGVSQEACELLAAADFIDLHLDLDVPVRLYGYNPSQRHEPAKKSPRLWGQTDFPRLREAGFTGVVYDIATNPVRPPKNRLETTKRNLTVAQGRTEHHPEDLAYIRTYGDYVRARSENKLALWLSLQGGNALLADPSVLDGEMGDALHRITLMHLTSSRLGSTSSPAGRDGGITPLGREFVERCNRKRILVDLAHSGKKTFWGALEAHDPSLPPIVSHTGVEGVLPHWRNVDDAQIRAIADRGGVVGVMYQSAFLEKLWMFQRGSRAKILDHLEHIFQIAGEDVPAIGTDYDGAITPPADLADVTEHPKLIQDMLDRKWSHQRILKLLGRNYLRVVEAVRP